MQIFNKKEKKQLPTESELIEQLMLRVTALEDRFENHAHVSPTAISNPSPYGILVIKGKGE